MSGKLPPMLGALLGKARPATAGGGQAMTMSEAQMRAIVDSAIPLNDKGLLLHPATLSVYAIAQHPMLTEKDRVVVRIPLSALFNAAIGAIGVIVIPEMGRAEVAANALAAKQKADAAQAGGTTEGAKPS